MYYDPTEPYKFNLDVAKTFINDEANSKYKEEYNMGKINRYYGYNILPKDIVQDYEGGKILIEKLQNFENIIIIGNGQSGSGKTAALISRTTNGISYPGLLPCIANSLIKNDENKNKQTFNKVNLKLINLYWNLSDELDDINKVSETFYHPQNINLKNNKGDEIIKDSYDFIPNGDTWECIISDKKEKSLEDYITEAFNIREEEPTKNNPNSSRSHIIVCVTFSGNNIYTGQSGESKLVICDLAGVEDKFTCEFLELMTLDRNYAKKSTKYRAYDDDGVIYKNDNGVFKDDKNKETKLMNFDNYFCKNKSNKYHYEDSNFPDAFPKACLESNKKCIDSIIKYIEYYENIVSSEADPILNNFYEIINSFNQNPKQNNDDSMFFTEIQSRLKTNDISLYKAIDIPNYEYKLSDFTNENTYAKHSSKKAILDTKSNGVLSDHNISTICTDRDTILTTINTFMKEFIELPIEFQSTYDEVPDVEDALDKKIRDKINLTKSFEDTETYISEIDGNINTHISTIKNIESVFRSVQDEKNALTKATRETTILNINNVLQTLCDNINNEITKTSDLIISYKPKNITSLDETNFFDNFNEIKINSDNIINSLSKLDNDTSNDKLFITNNIAEAKNTCNNGTKSTINLPSINKIIKKAEINIKCIKDAEIFYLQQNKDDIQNQITTFESKKKQNLDTLRETLAKQQTLLAQSQKVKSTLEQNIAQNKQTIMANSAQLKAINDKENDNTIYNQKFTDKLFNNIIARLTEPVSNGSINNTGTFAFAELNNDEIKIINTANGLKKDWGNGIVKKRGLDSLHGNSTLNEGYVTVHRQIKKEFEKFKKTITESEKKQISDIPIENNNLTENIKKLNIKLKEVTTQIPIYQSEITSLETQIKTENDTMFNPIAEEIRVDGEIKETTTRLILEYKEDIKMEINDTIQKLNNLIKTKQDYKMLIKPLIDKFNICKNEDLIDAAKAEAQLKIKEKLVEIQQLYFTNLINNRFTTLNNNIQKYTNNDRVTDIKEIKSLIQQLIRYTQLKFNCKIRRKEGYMINTSLKYMQKFIGSILFKSAKNKFNKNLIENNLLTLPNKYTSYINYIKYYNDITLDINNLIKSLEEIYTCIIANNNNAGRMSVTELEKSIKKECNEIKNKILKNFSFIIYSMNENLIEDKYDYLEPYDLSLILIYICFIDIILVYLDNDNKISFEIIYYKLTQIYSSVDFAEQEKKKNNTSYSFTNFEKGVIQILLNISRNTKQEYNEENNIIVQLLKKIFKLSKITETEDSTKVEEDYLILSVIDKYSKESNNISKFRNIYQMFTQLFGNNDTSNNNITFDDFKFSNTDKIKVHNFNISISGIWNLLRSYTQEQITKYESLLSTYIKTDKELLISPLLYDSPSLSTCIENKSKYDYEFNKFYNMSDNGKDLNLEILFKIMTSADKIQLNGTNTTIDGFNLDIDKSTILLVTVINITPSPLVAINNPPIPPFININKLKLIYKMLNLKIGNKTILECFKNGSTIQTDLSSFSTKIISYTSKFIEYLNTYEFYKELDLGYIVIKKATDKQNIFAEWSYLVHEDGIKSFKNIIDLIDSNNAATLIGTVDFDKYSKIRDPDELYFICDNKKDSLLKQLDSFTDLMTELDLLITNDDIKSYQND